MQNDDFNILSKSELGSKIGQRIKAIRQEKGISQAELARLCVKDKQHIELIENNKISANIYTLYIISNALKIELKTLFDFN